MGSRQVRGHSHQFSFPGRGLYAGSKEGNHFRVGHLQPEIGVSQIRKGADQGQAGHLGPAKQAGGHGQTSVRV